MGEAQELFAGWTDYPPTNILVKALVAGFGGGKAQPMADVPPEVFDNMQRSAAAAIAAKAGSRLPIIRGRDKGLPKAAPVFDMEELRKRNAAVGKRKVLK